MLNLRLIPGAPQSVATVSRDVLVVHNSSNRLDVVEYAPMPPEIINYEFLDPTNVSALTPAGVVLFELLSDNQLRRYAALEGNFTNIFRIDGLTELFLTTDDSLLSWDPSTDSTTLLISSFSNFHSNFELTHCFPIDALRIVFLGQSGSAYVYDFEMDTHELAFSIDDSILHAGYYDHYVFLGCSDQVLTLDTANFARTAVSGYVIFTQDRHVLLGSSATLFDLAIDNAGADSDLPPYGLLESAVMLKDPPRVAVLSQLEGLNFHTLSQCRTPSTVACGDSDKEIDASEYSHFEARPIIEEEDPSHLAFVELLEETLTPILERLEAAEATINAVVEHIQENEQRETKETPSHLIQDSQQDLEAMIQEHEERLEDLEGLPTHIGNLSARLTVVETASERDDKTKSIAQLLKRVMKLEAELNSLRSSIKQPSTVLENSSAIISEEEKHPRPAIFGDGCATPTVTPLLPRIRPQTEEYIPAIIHSPLADSKRTPVKASPRAIRTPRVGRVVVPVLNSSLGQILNALSETDVMVQLIREFEIQNENRIHRRAEDVLTTALDCIQPTNYQFQSVMNTLSPIVSKATEPLIRGWGRFLTVSLATGCRFCINAVSPLAVLGPFFAKESLTRSVKALMVYWGAHFFPEAVADYALQYAEWCSQQCSGSEPSLLRSLPSRELCTFLLSVRRCAIPIDLPSTYSIHEIFPHFYDSPFPSPDQVSLSACSTDLLPCFSKLPPCLVQCFWSKFEANGIIPAIELEYGEYNEIDLCYYDPTATLIIRVPQWMRFNHGDVIASDRLRRLVTALLYMYFLDKFKDPRFVPFVRHEFTH